MKLHHKFHRFFASVRSISFRSINKAIYFMEKSIGPLAILRSFKGTLMQI